MRITTLNLLYYPFRLKVEAAFNEINKTGLPVKLFETFRTRKRQSELWSQGRLTDGDKVTRSKPGQSYHNYGLAVDFALWIDDTWAWAPKDIYLKAGPYFESQGLTWLGRSTSDLGHVQYKSRLNIEQLQIIYDKEGLEAVWLALDQNR